MDTLKAFREQAGLSAEDVIKTGSAMDDEFPTTAHAIYNIERRGTDSYRVMRVFAKLYGKSLDEIAAASQSQKTPCPL